VEGWGVVQVEAAEEEEVVQEVGLPEVQQAVLQGVLQVVLQVVLHRVVGPVDFRLADPLEGLAGQEVVHQGRKDRHRVPTDPVVALLVSQGGPS
jgi:hypothetical protein